METEVFINPAGPKILAFMVGVYYLNILNCLDRFKANTVNTRVKHVIDIILLRAE